jgi:predicted O-methyltransferase YrrM
MPKEKRTGGKVTTVEINPPIAAAAREVFRQSGLDGLIDSRINNAPVEIPASG